MSTEGPKEVPSAGAMAGEQKPAVGTDEAQGSATPAEKVPEAGGVAEGVRMVLTVAVVTLLSGAVLGFIYRQTEPHIEAAKLKEKTIALANILPEFDNPILETERCAEPDGAPVDDKCLRKMYTAMKGGSVVGYALETFTTEGYSGRIDMLVGASPDFAVTGIYILAHKETPGLGAKIVEGNKDWKNPEAIARPDRPFILQFAGKRLGEFDFRVKVDGGDVDSITASTITCRAVGKAVEEALKLLRDRAASRQSATGTAEGGAP